MRVGIPVETFAGEGRVAAAPSAVRMLVAEGHQVLVEQGAGDASGLTDDAYIRAGAEMVPTPEEVFHRVDLVWKVLRPSAHEATLGRPGQRVAALWNGRTGPGALPLDEIPGVRAAMSEIAGRLAIEQASAALQRQHGGRGLLLGGVPGVAPASVAVIGGGAAGAAAAALAAAVGAAVTVLDVDVSRLRALAGVQTRYATAHNVEAAMAMADVVVIAVRSAARGGEAGAAPVVAGRGHLALMQAGAVLVDLSLADGGGLDGGVETTLEAPTTLIDGVVYVGVPNLCGGVPRTASLALSQAAMGTVAGWLATTPRT
jgi:alanine dehydrogenase